MSNDCDYTKLPKLICEFLGSMFLVVAAISPIILFHHVLGESIAIDGAENLSLALAIIADTLAVGFVLFILIEMFGPISGAHFNPAVSFCMVVAGKMRFPEALAYCAAQIAGGVEKRP